MKWCMVTVSVSLALLLLTVSQGEANLSGQRQCGQSVSGPINLPADDSLHAYTEYSDEWWYWTSHLKTLDGREFGFAEIIYTILAGPDFPVYYGDHTISDLANQKYHYNDRMFEYGPPAYVPDGFEFFLGPDHVVGGNGHDKIHSVIDDGTVRYVVDLEMVAVKSPVIQLATDFNKYYSRERMFTWGTIEVDGEVSNVYGFTWFDHQFGDQLVTLSTVANWTWVAIQLNDMQELIVLRLLFQDGSELAFAHLSDQQCNTTSYGPGEFTLTPTGSWAPPDGSCVYPLGWDVGIPAAGLDLHVEPFFIEQEIWVPGVDRYYEGDSKVTGTRKSPRSFPWPTNGRAYVELYGFCPW